jgi:hypothetical protein
MAEATGSPALNATTRRSKARRAIRSEEEEEVITRLSQVETKGAVMLLAAP